MRNEDPSLAMKRSGFFHCLAKPFLPALNQVCGLSKANDNVPDVGGTSENHIVHEVGIQ
jgi:hypothetical protein